MSERQLFLDRGFGETRGVVTLKGRPERLILVRDGADPAQALGARVAGRITRLERAMASAFVDLGGESQAVMDLKPDMPRLNEGQAVIAEIRSEARNGKGPSLRFIEPGEGAPRLLEPGPSLSEQLRSFDRTAPIVEGEAARAAADLAEAEALETLFPLPGGGQIAVEPTRALVAVDVDLGASAAQEAKRAARVANLAALGVAARVLRLKGLGGLVVVDLVGRGHDGPTLAAAARSAFAPDNPGVSIGPISRFGTLELAIPRRRRPVIEDLLEPDGRPRPFTVAMRLIRDLERQGRASPGDRLVAACSPEVAEAARPALASLAEVIGRRLELQPVDGFQRQKTEISAR